MDADSGEIEALLKRACAKLGTEDAEKLRELAKRRRTAAA